MTPTKKLCHISTAFIIALIPVLISCESSTTARPPAYESHLSGSFLRVVELENYIHSSTNAIEVQVDSVSSYVHLDENGWIAFHAEIPVSGKYDISIQASSNTPDPTTLWIEDHLDKPFGQPHNITGKIIFHDTIGKFSTVTVVGTPLRSGNHSMKLHFDQGINIDCIKFNLLHEKKPTPLHLKQHTEGNQWSLVWSDEFESGTIDSTKWSFDFGNWGWGENGLQNYTDCHEKNAWVQNGKLIIEARKNDRGNEWTSARLSTQGKVSFLYGKYEIRAKVPANDGTWASVWTRGDQYVDEGSKHTCGEISILDCRGDEINDETGSGTVHASKHVGSDYFNVEGQNSGSIVVEDLSGKFHTYSVEWMPNKIMEYVDDKLYAVYDESSTDLSWPHDNSQNIIMELAIGGNSGGQTAMHEHVKSSRMIIDYVRVYELR
jgi:beta-glucanase (GH16 family)